MSNVESTPERQESQSSKGLLCGPIRDQGPVLPETSRGLAEGSRDAPGIRVWGCGLQGPGLSPEAASLVSPVTWQGPGAWSQDSGHSSDGDSKGEGDRDDMGNVGVSARYIASPQIEGLANGFHGKIDVVCIST